MGANRGIRLSVQRNGGNYEDRDDQKKKRETTRPSPECSPKHSSRRHNCPKHSSPKHGRPLDLSLLGGRRTNCEVNCEARLSNLLMQLTCNQGNDTGSRCRGMEPLYSSPHVRICDGCHRTLWIIGPAVVRHSPAHARRFGCVVGVCGHEMEILTTARHLMSDGVRKRCEGLRKIVGVV
jgi:hypothetical protein